jgi:hypothetical protein
LPAGARNVVACHAVAEERIALHSGV